LIKSERERKSKEEREREREERGLFFAASSGFFLNS